eukprot:1693583-Rhodomonas_salina.1
MKTAWAAVTDCSACCTSAYAVFDCSVCAMRAALRLFASWITRLSAPSSTWKTASCLRVTADMCAGGRHGHVTDVQRYAPFFTTGPRRGD